MAEALPLSPKVVPVALLAVLIAVNAISKGDYRTAAKALLILAAAVLGVLTVSYSATVTLRVGLTY